MKIRTDFVTNSSSVSYILTMSKEMAELYLKNFESHLTSDVKTIIRFLIKDMLQNGTRVMLENEELYIKKIKFGTDETRSDDCFDVPMDQVDFSTIDEDDLWAYIFGKYIMDGKLKEVWGFGVTQTDTY